MRRYNDDDPTHREPFNDAMEHMSEIEGYPAKQTNFRKLPKAIRYLGFFLISFFAVLMMLAFLSQFFD